MTVKVFTPGPTEVPQSVIDSVSKHKIHHRSVEFKRLYGSVMQKLKKIFFTEQNLVVLTGSGTAAMEAAVVNFCSYNDRILYVNQGRFGKRWGEICAAFALNADELYTEPGNAVDINQLLNHNIGNYDVIFLTHSETSTATFTDVKKVTEFIKNNSNALVIVDSITSIGALEFKMDEWKIDCAVSASQKGLMCPPGLSVVAFNDKCREKMNRNDVSRYYLDLRKELASAQDNITSWTPSVGLFFGLDTASDLILNEGLENLWARVKKTAGYFRSESTKNGFKIFSKHPVDSLTALAMPEGIKSDILIKLMKENHGLLIANGQDELHGKIIRVSHMGALKMDDFVRLSVLLKQELDNIILQG